MQDRFSKWVKLHPLCRAMAAVVTQAVADNIIFHPKIMLSDNGTQFESVQLESSSPHTKSITRIRQYTRRNLVEHTNRMTKTMIAQLRSKPPKLRRANPANTVCVQFCTTQCHRVYAGVFKSRTRIAVTCKCKK